MNVLLSHFRWRSQYRYFFWFQISNFKPSLKRWYVCSFPFCPPPLSLLIYVYISWWYLSCFTLFSQENGFRSYLQRNLWRERREPPRDFRRTQISLNSLFASFEMYHCISHIITLMLLLIFDLALSIYLSLLFAKQNLTSRPRCNSNRRNRVRFHVSI